MSERAQVFNYTDGYKARLKYGEHLARVRRTIVVRLLRKSREEEGLCTKPSCPLYGQWDPEGCKHGKEEEAPFFKCRDEYCPNYASDTLFLCPMEHSGGPDPEFPPGDGPMEA